MKNILRITTLCLAVFALSFSVQAQKFGYVNTNKILEELPEVKQADANIAALQKQLESKYQKDVQALQTLYADIQGKVQSGTLSPKQQEEEAAKIRTQEEAIRKFEAESQNKLVNKRTELIQPIIDKVNAAIQAVGKEGGYQFIFDEQVLLYKESAQDVTDKVKAKLATN
ncbi:MAG: OmpH family outer membrane protein [Bacteroidota bacterium]